MSVCMALSTRVSACGETLFTDSRSLFLAIKLAHSLARDATPVQLHKIM